GNFRSPAVTPTPLIPSPAGQARYGRATRADCSCPHAPHPRALPGKPGMDALPAPTDCSPEGRGHCHEQGRGRRLKTAEAAPLLLTICALRTFQPARGGEASGVSSGVGPGSASWTRLLVRRGTPFAALAAIF